MAARVRVQYRKKHSHVYELSKRLKFQTPCFSQLFSLLFLLDQGVLRSYCDVTGWVSSNLLQEVL